MNWKNQYEKKSVWGRFKSWMWVQTKRVALIGLFIGSGYSIAYIRAADAEIIYRDVVKEVQVKVTEVPPIMKRIAKCESGDTHFKNGQVVLNGNTNRTSDIGRYQINTLWSKKATEMGLDLTKEKDNETFAMYLYHTQGTEPWYSSAQCWK